MRIALIGPSHWHYEMYLPGLQAADIDVVAVADANMSYGHEVARAWGCPHFVDYRKMVEQTKPDFVFAFGRHLDMPDIALSLLESRIPFSIEKPCGVSSDGVQRVGTVAETKDVFVSIPFHYRLSSMYSVLASLAPLPSSHFHGAHFRIIAGSPDRFLDSSPWLTNPIVAGGGCMMNLAHHAIDFMLFVTGSTAVEVEAQTSNVALDLPVEDTARMLLRLDNGAECVIETGYTHPADARSYMEFGFQARHRDFSAQSVDAGLQVMRAGEDASTCLPTNWRFKDYFAAYVGDTLLRFKTGKPPIATLSDMQVTMDVVQAAYESSRTSRAVKIRRSFSELTSR